MHSRAFSTFMDKVVNRRGEKFIHNWRMKRGKFRKDRLAEVMQTHGIKKNAELARFLKRNPQTTHKWFPENPGGTKNISAADLFLIADSFDVNARWLMGISDTQGKAFVPTDEQRACLDIYDQIKRHSEGWAEDWLANGQQILSRLDSNEAVPFVRKNLTKSG